MRDSRLSRYRLIPYSPGLHSPKELLQLVVNDARDGSRALSRDEPWIAIVEHLNAMDARMLVVQNAVSDPDFIEEHRMVYAHQHRTVGRWCLRLHAFNDAKGISEPSAEPELVLGYLDEVHGVSDSYLGFVTLRPVWHARVGATFLRPLRREHVTALARFDVEVTGMRFVVQGTPFLQQDSAAGACAQASMWMALRTLSQKMRRQRVSVVELTLGASREKRFNRRSPGEDGLTVGEMVEALRAIGHHYFHFDIPRSQVGDGDEVLRTIGPYLDSGLPVILALSMDGDAGHAIVAIGRELTSQPVLAPSAEERQGQVRHAEGWIGQLLVHNDNSGPYRNLPVQGLVDGEYHAGLTKSMIVPLPSAVLMSAKQAQIVALKDGLFLLWQTMGSASEHAPNGLKLPALVLRAYLCSRHVWRAWAKESTHMGNAARNAYRASALPELLWVVEVHQASLFNPVELRTNSCAGEILLDAAADARAGQSVVGGRLVSDLVAELPIGRELLFIHDDSDPVWIGSAAGLGPGCSQQGYAT